MPIFEYQCKRCGAITEFLEGVSQEKVKRVCGKCKSAELDRVISRVNVSVHDHSSRSETCRAVCGKDGPCQRPVPPCAGGMCGM